MAQSTRDWRRLAIVLVRATFAYNAIEGAVAIGAGWRAGSIALVGFGLDSVIELAAASALLWRLGVEARLGDSEVVAHAERRVHRFIGGTFLLLAVYVVLMSLWILVRRQGPAESLIGIVLALASLVVMPVVAWWKLKAAAALGSGALRAEAKETLACSYLSFTLFLGLAANAIAGWWWADPMAALLMVPWLVKEGLEGLEGKGCAGDCPVPAPASDRETARVDSARVMADERIAE